VTQCLLATLNIAKKVTACFIINLSPEGDFINGTKTARADIVIIQAALADTR